MNVKNSIFILLAISLLSNLCSMHASETYLSQNNFTGSQYLVTINGIFNALEKNPNIIGYDLTKKLIEIRYANYTGPNQYDILLNVLSQRMIKALLETSPLPLSYFINLTENAIPVVHEGLVLQIRAGQATMSAPLRPWSPSPTPQAPARPSSPAPTTKPATSSVAPKMSDWERFKNFFRTK